jgi:hypothetical protein
VSVLASKPLGRFLPVWPQNRWRRFLIGLASKPVAMVSSGLASKHIVMVFTGLASKPVVTVSGSLASKLAAMVFSSLASKLVATVSPGLASKLVDDFFVEPQNQGGGGFPGLGLKTSSSGLVIWASKSLRRFMVWASKPSGLRFFICATKLTDGGWRGTHVEILWLASRESKSG